MTYDEFIAGTGCKQNATNYAIFQGLESIYMNVPGFSKETIYNAAKKSGLLNNEKSPEEIETEKKIADEKRDLINQIEYAKKQVAYNKYLNLEFPGSGYDRVARSYTEDTKDLKNRLAGLNQFFPDIKPSEKTNE